MILAESVIWEDDDEWRNGMDFTYDFAYENERIRKEAEDFIYSMLDKIPEDFTHAHIDYIGSMFDWSLKKVKNNFKYRAKIPQSHKEGEDGNEVEKFVDDFIDDGRIDRLEDEVKVLRALLEVHMEQDMEQNREKRGILQKISETIKNAFGGGL